MQAAMDRLTALPRAPRAAGARRCGWCCCSRPLPFAAQADRAPHQRRLHRPRLRLRGRRRGARRTSRAPSASRSPSWSRARDGASAADVRAQIDRVDAVGRAACRTSSSPTARRPRPSASAGAVADRDRAPRRDAATRTRRPTSPWTCARSSASGEGPRRRRPDLPRRPAGAVGRHAGPLQGGPRGRRGHRLPDRAADPARRLRLARGGGAAAGPRASRA